MGRLTSWVLKHKRLVVAFWAVVTVVAFASLQPASDALSQRVHGSGPRGVRDEPRRSPRPTATAATSRRSCRSSRSARGRPSTPPASRASSARHWPEVQAALPQARIASYASTHDRDFVSARRPHDLRARLHPGRRAASIPARPRPAARRPRSTASPSAGSPVEVTGLDALRAAAKRPARARHERERVETLAAGARRADRARVRLRSFMAIVPLLMAVGRDPDDLPARSGRSRSVTDVSVVVQFLVALVGLGIAIDYALLVVVRWREERRRET